MFLCDYVGRLLFGQTFNRKSKAIYFGIGIIIVLVFRNYCKVVHPNMLLSLSFSFFSFLFFFYLASILLTLAHAVCNL